MNNISLVLQTILLNMNQMQGLFLQLLFCTIESLSAFVRCSPTQRLYKANVFYPHHEDILERTPRGIQVSPLTLILLEISIYIFWYWLC